MIKNLVFFPVKWCQQWTSDEVIATSQLCPLFCNVPLWNYWKRGRLRGTAGQDHSLHKKLFDPQAIQTSWVVEFRSPNANLLARIKTKIISHVHCILMLCLLHLFCGTKNVIISTAPFNMFNYNLSYLIIMMIFNKREVLCNQNIQRSIILGNHGDNSKQTSINMIILG